VRAAVAVDLSRGGPGRHHRAHQGGVTGRLRHRKGLTAQYGLIALQGPYVAEAYIGRHHRPRPEFDQVAGDQVGDVAGDQTTVTVNEGTVPKPVVQRVHGTLGAVLVDETEPDAHRHDGGDDNRVGSLGDEEGHPCRS
jgi:hypothetical protein